MKSKVFIACGVEKPMTEYYQNGKGGFHSRCVDCYRARQASRYYTPEKEQTRNEARGRSSGYYRKSNKVYTVISAPDDSWPVGCELYGDGVENTLALGNFDPGMVLEHNGGRYRVIGNYGARQGLKWLGGVK
jgi:hypothetical protein